MLLPSGEHLGGAQAGEGGAVGPGGDQGTCERAPSADQCRKQKLQHRCYGVAAERTGVLY